MAPESHCCVMHMCANRACGILSIHTYEYKCVLVREHAYYNSINIITFCQHLFFKPKCTLANLTLLYHLSILCPNLAMGTLTLALPGPPYPSLNPGSLLNSAARWFFKNLLCRTLFVKKCKKGFVVWLTSVITSSSDRCNWVFKQSFNRLFWYFKSGNTK